MSLVKVTAINYIVMTVGECKPLNWEYQEEDTRNEYAKLYKVKGMPILSKDTDSVEDISELVLLSREGREVEVIIDSEVQVGATVIVQEVLNHDGVSVGTYQNTAPVKTDEGEATYTGIVLGELEGGGVQVYTLQGGVELPEMWVVSEGLTVNPDNSGEDVVSLGGAIRFLLNDDDKLLDGMTEVQKFVRHIDVINKYV